MISLGGVTSIGIVRPLHERIVSSSPGRPKDRSKMSIKYANSSHHIPSLVQGLSRAAGRPGSQSAKPRLRMPRVPNRLVERSPGSLGRPRGPRSQIWPISEISSAERNPYDNFHLADFFAPSRQILLNTARCSVSSMAAWRRPVDQGHLPRPKATLRRKTPDQQPPGLVTDADVRSFSIWRRTTMVRSLSGPSPDDRFKTTEGPRFRQSRGG